MAAQKMNNLTTMPVPPNRLSDSPTVFSEKAQATVDAQKRMVDEFNTNIVPAHNEMVAPINSVLANLPNISTVASINTSVTTVAALQPQIYVVDALKNQISRLATSVTQIDRIAVSADKMDRVFTSIDKVDTVQAHIANVDAVGTSIANVNTVSNNMPSVVANANNIAYIYSVALDLSKVITVSEHIVKVDTVADHIANVDTVVANMPKVDAVSKDIANVNTVASIAPAITSIVADKATIDTVYGKLPTIQNVETNLAHIVAVDEAETAIKTLGLHIGNIDAVGAHIDEVNGVYDSLADIAAVKNNIPFVKNVSDHIVNVDAVGRNIEAVKEVDRRMDLVIAAPDNAASANDAAVAAKKDAALAKEYADAASAVTELPVATADNDKQVIYFNAAKMKYDLGSTIGESIVPAPAISVASQLPVGHPSPITLTGLAGIVGTTIVTFQLQVNGDPIKDIAAVNNSYTGTITAQGSGGTVWTIKARAIDSKGNTSPWNQITTTLVLPKVNTPTVTSPLSGAIVNNKTIAMASSPFGTVYLSDTHKASRWILSTDVEGNNILHDSGWRQDALTAYTAILSPVADKNSTIYMHVQHEGVLIGQSVRSAAVAVKTSYVVRPSVTSPLLSTMVGTDRVEMTCSPFVTYAGDYDTHVSTRWWVTTDAEGNNALCDSGWVSSYLTAYTAVLNPLADPSSSLYLWVAHKGELLGDSEKSTSVRVVTGAVQAPVITAPAANAYVLPTTFTVTGSAFAPVVGATDTMKAIYVQVATDTLFTNKIYDSGRVVTDSTTHVVAFAAQPQAATLYVRIRYEGTTLGISGYSEPVSVVTTKVNDVVITSPISGATGVPTKPLITMSAYGSTGNLDTGANTQVQIASDASFATIVYDSGEGAYNTTHSVVTALSPAVQYFIRVRHKGSILGWTAWSVSVSMTTGQVQTPSVTSPAEGGYILPATFTLVGSAFVALGAADTLKAVTIQVAKDIGFTNMVYNQRVVTTSTTHAVTIPVQAQGATLFTRVQYEGNGLGVSEWGAPRRLVVTTVIAPSITSPVDGATGVILRPTITMTPWSDTGGLDTGSKTRVQISEKADFSTIAWDSGEIAYTTSVQCDVKLSPHKLYYIRAQHSSFNCGWTEQSSVLRIRTAYINYMSIFGSSTTEYAMKVLRIYSNYIYYYAFFGTGGGAESILGTMTFVAKDGTPTNAQVKHFMGSTAPKQYNDACYVSNVGIVTCGTSYILSPNYYTSNISLFTFNKKTERLDIVYNYRFISDFICCLYCAECTDNKMLVVWKVFGDGKGSSGFYGMTLFKVTTSGLSILDSCALPYPTSSVTPQQIITNVTALLNVPKSDDFYIACISKTNPSNYNYSTQAIMKVSCATGKIQVTMSRSLESEVYINEPDLRIYGLSLDGTGNIIAYGMKYRTGLVIRFDLEISKYYGATLLIPDQYMSSVACVTYFPETNKLYFGYNEDPIGARSLKGFSIGELDIQISEINIKNVTQIACSDYFPSNISEIFYDNYNFGALFIGNTQSRGTHGWVDFITGSIPNDNAPVTSTFPAPVGWTATPSTYITVNNLGVKPTINTNVPILTSINVQVEQVLFSANDRAYEQGFYEF